VASADIPDIRYTNTGRFFLLPLNNRRTNHLPIIPTRRAGPVAFGNREEQHIQPIRKKEKEKN
jgi:hypothetical protein